MVEGRWLIEPDGLERYLAGLHKPEPTASPRQTFLPALEGRTSALAEALAALAQDYRMAMTQLGQLEARAARAESEARLLAERADERVVVERQARELAEERATRADDELAAARARIAELEASTAARVAPRRPWWAPWRRPSEASPASF
jgi:hypothetical protein